MASVQSRGVNNTAFSPNADFTAQMTGTGQPISGSLTPTYAATIDLNPTFSISSFALIVTTSAIGNATLTASNVANAGAIRNIQINNDSGGARTITFGTGFRSTGTVVGTANKAFVVQFISDGTTWNEVSRSAAALT